MELGGRIRNKDGERYCNIQSRRNKKKEGQHHNIDIQLRELGKDRRSDKRMEEKREERIITGRNFNIRIEVEGGI